MSSETKDSKTVRAIDAGMYKVIFNSSNGSLRISFWDSGRTCGFSEAADYIVERFGAAALVDYFTTSTIRCSSESIAKGGEVRTYEIVGS